MDFYITPQQFGAAGDGIADDTEAIRAAADEAAKTGKTLFFPVGIYRTDVIKVPAAVEFRAQATWSYRKPGRTVLVPATDNQYCVLDVSDALGTTIYGLAIDGGKKGTSIHGLYMDREKHVTFGEHSLRIDTCQVRDCTGNGFHAEGAWAVSVRKSQFCGNDGYGMYLDGCDCFIVDNWFSFNGKAGFGGETWNSAVNFTSNRVEWNRDCGVRLSGGMRYNITGNYFDRSYGPSIVIEAAPNYHKRLHKTHTVMPYGITVTGNNFIRSGKEAEQGSDRDCHIFMRRAAGITVTANTFNIWKDDGRNGRISPFYGIITEECAHCAITGNVLLPGAVKELIHDKGGHGEGMVVENNTGAVLPEAAYNCQDPFTPVHFMSEGNAPWYSDILKGENND